MSLGVLHLSCTVLHLSCTCPAPVLHLSCTVLHGPFGAQNTVKLFILWSSTRWSSLTPVGVPLCGFLARSTVKSPLNALNSPRKKIFTYRMTKTDIGGAVATGTPDQ